MSRILVSAAARTTSGDSGALSLPLLYRVESADLLLNVTAAGSVAADTLDVYLQSSPDDGTTWDDFVHFTQVLGNGGAKAYLAKWCRYVAPEREMGAPQDAAMSAGVNQGPNTPLWRVKWVIANGGGTHSFTFSVTASFVERK